MEPFPVVEQLDIPESGLPHVFDVLEVTPVGHLLLEACEEAFHAGVVVGAARCAHRGRYPVLREHRAVTHATVLHAAVGMEDEPVVMAALHDGIGQRALDKFRVDVLAYGVAHRLLVTQVQHHGKVHPAKRSLDVGDVAGPDGVQAVGIELTLHQVLAVHGVAFALAVGFPLPECDWIEPVLAHDAAQFPHLYLDTLVLECRQHLRATVHAMVFFEGVADLLDKPFFAGLAFGPCRFLF